MDGFQRYLGGADNDSSRRLRKREKQSQLPHLWHEQLSGRCQPFTIRESSGGEAFGRISYLN